MANIDEVDVGDDAISIECDIELSAEICDADDLFSRVSVGEMVVVAVSVREAAEEVEVGVEHC